MTRPSRGAREPEQGEVCTACRNSEGMKDGAGITEIVLKGSGSCGSFGARVVSPLIDETEAAGIGLFPRLFKSHLIFECRQRARQRGSKYVQSGKTPSGKTNPISGQELPCKLNCFQCLEILTEA